MPDLITHTFLAVLMNKITPGSMRKFQIVFFFLVGNMVPDIFSRAPMVLSPENIPFFTVYHTLLGGVIISYIIALFFNVARRKNIFLCLFAGSVFHQIIDLVQKNLFGGGYKLFFPLDVEVSVGFIWPEGSLYVLPFLFVFVMIVYWKQIIKIIKKNRG